MNSPETPYNPDPSDEDTEKFLELLTYGIKMSFNNIAGEEHANNMLLEWTKLHVVEEEHEVLDEMLINDPNELWRIAANMAIQDTDGLEKFTDAYEKKLANLNKKNSLKDSISQLISRRGGRRRK